MKTKLEIVREAVIAAVPEIKKLDFGCEIRIKEGSRYYEEMKKAYGTSFFYNGRSLVNQISSVSLIEMTTRSGDFEILGRPVRLTDVLFAISNRGQACDYFLSRYGAGMFAIMSQDNIGYQCHWDLRSDDLSLQSPATIDFLAGLLAK